MHPVRSGPRWVVALTATILLVTGCAPTSTSDVPLALGTAAPESTAAARSAPVATSVPTPEPTIDPAAPCTKDCWPLSGKPAKVGATDRRPLIVKIDNAPAARPHYGLAQADMVFEILVEGFVTRLAAVFQSQDPQTIGAVRSARLADRSLTPMFDGALVYSGTSAYAWKLISRDAADGKYVELSADHAGGYYRVSFRAAPYNLFTSAQNMRQQLAAIGAQGSAKVPAWGFLATTEHPATVAGMAGGTEATEVTIPYRKDSSLVTYKYDASTRTYQRFQNNDGKAVREVDALTSTPVNASTVVVIHTEIWEVDEIVDAAGSHAHDMRLLGKGAATVFRDGLRQEATWSRQHDSDPFTFASAAGEKILLDAGQTWVHVIPNEWEVPSK